MSGNYALRRVGALAVSLLFVFPMVQLVTAPAASAVAFEGCSTDPADYGSNQHRVIDGGNGHFEQWWNFNVANDSQDYCVLIHIKDTTATNGDCYDGMFDFGNPVHYDSRQFISCDQGNLKVVAYKDNEAGKQNNTGDTDFGTCVRNSTAFGSFQTPCNWQIGGGTVDDTGKWPRNPSSRSDFMTWTGANGALTCYDEGSALNNCANFADN